MGRNRLDGQYWTVPAAQLRSRPAAGTASLFRPALAIRQGHARASGMATTPFPGRGAGQAPLGPGPFLRPLAAWSTHRSSRFDGFRQHVQDPSARSATSFRGRSPFSLAHSVGSTRSSVSAIRPFEKRRKLMDAMADYCTSRHRRGAWYRSDGDQVTTQLEADLEILLRAFRIRLLAPLRPGGKFNCTAASPGCGGAPGCRHVSHPLRCRRRHCPGLHRP